MKKSLIFFFVISSLAKAQFDGPANQPGSKAIYKDDLSFVAWATGATVTRGLQDIAVKNNTFASAGVEANVSGIADNSIVSLGDGGSAIVTFANPIKNETGADFAVFENAFSDTFLELAFVEVSSDGVNYFRFPAISNTQTTTQIGGFGSVDATKLNNLAGKYKALYGTPFNLDDVADNVLLNKNAVTQVKIIDVIGTIDPTYASYDSEGKIINELYNTPFASGGFDLDAVGVIHQAGNLSVNNSLQNNAEKFQNPARDVIRFFAKENLDIKIYDLSGKLVREGKTVNYSFNISGINPGIYLLVTNSFSSKLIIK